MAITEKQQRFIEEIAKNVQKYAYVYGILVHSPIIAQAILESGWGESKLAAKYHNYFGLKCGSKWTGKSVNLTTQEEYQPGTLTTIKDNFRVYDSMEEGVKGYFEFIQLQRYQNLRGITDPKEYLQMIKNDGYATSSTYVESNYRLITQYGLTKYDKEDTAMTENRIRQAMVARARKYIGCKESNGTHKQIIDIYNNHKPLARGYAVKYTDAWCATFGSAIAILEGHTDIIPTECGCDVQIKLWQAKGRWQENDAYVPQAGDYIYYDWQDNGVGDDRSSSDHVGIVESCNGKTITVIEGNKNDAVGERQLAVNGRYIRGFGLPNYASKATKEAAPAQKPAAKKDVTTVAKEVLAGAWGNGDERKNRLTAAGYDYAAVQAEVNRLASGASTPKKSTTEIAKEVLAGKWGNGDDRKKKLQTAGYNYAAVQAEVNRLAKGGSSTKKSVTAVAKEVLAGKWGNGDARKKKLQAAGYNYNAVQKEVNRLMR